MSKLKLYKLNEEYIEFLRQYDNKVLFNKNQKRIYVGIISIINNMKYFIPLSSPKEKHKNMKDTIDFHKINDGKDGAINFNNMIPIINEAIIDFNITNENKIGYRNVLFNQIKFIKKNSDLIIEKAENLYDKVTKYHSYISNRCVNFKLLESVSELYGVYQEVAVTNNQDNKG